jgi:hypothetical protein
LKVGSNRLGDPLAVSEAKGPQTAAAAVREVQRLAMTAAGAVAFFRTGDLRTGNFQDTAVIRSFGTVPSADDLFGAGRQTGRIDNGWQLR